MYCTHAPTIYIPPIRRWNIFANASTHHADPNPQSVLVRLLLGAPLPPDIFK
jgi:hypothetical protein